MLDSVLQASRRLTSLFAGLFRPNITHVNTRWPLKWKRVQLSPDPPKGITDAMFKRPKAGRSNAGALRWVGWVSTFGIGGWGLVSTMATS
jgi:hypothetical protein